MTREIKFRGKSIATGEWLYGDLQQFQSERFIFPINTMNMYDDYSVIPETVGQFTGLKDKNGKELV